MVKDPVCKMDVDETKAKYQTPYKGQTYYFCSDSCKTRFEKAPEEFVSSD
jgi:Cu+-exporting ATPase